MSGATNELLPPIVIVDDDRDDLFFLLRSLARAGVRNQVYSFDRAECAVAFLRCCDPSLAQPTPMPCLVLTDRKMPGMDRLDLLLCVRKQAHLDGLSVVILSNAVEPSEVLRVQRHGASGYYEKIPAALN